MSDSGVVRRAESVRGLLQKTAARKKAAAQDQARIDRKLALDRKAARKIDARAKIIVGGSVGTALREKVPQTNEILDMLKASLSTYDWNTIAPALSPTEQTDVAFSFPVMTPNQRNTTDEMERRKQAAHQKIIIGGAVIAAIKKDAPMARTLIGLLDERIGSLRDRETVRGVAPIPEFRAQRHR